MPEFPCNYNMKVYEVKVGNILIGGENPLSVQSMTNTFTSDIEASTNQVTELSEAGCDIVRLTSRDLKEANCLNEIRNKLKQKGLNIPLVADVHFNPKVALQAALFADKVRINPGNYVDKRRGKTDFSSEDNTAERIKIKQNLLPLIDICKQNNVAIRVGVNHGSLSERMLYNYGNTAKGMVESAIEFIEIFREEEFHNLVISLKASHVKTMLEANFLMHDEMTKRGYCYPMHLGVTEAGDGLDARVKSAAGIASLLSQKIGDTIRVSLTENPVEEVPFANKICRLFSKDSEKYHPAKAEIINNTLKLNYSLNDFDELIIRAAVDTTVLNLNNDFKELEISNKGRLENSLSDSVLQALGIKVTKAEFIACPGCGRTLFNLMDELQKVKTSTSHLKGLKIAVMGCIVNGIGEMADADYGYVGAGPDKVNIYKQKTLVAKNILSENAVEELIKLIKDSGDWVD